MRASDSFKLSPFETVLLPEQLQPSEQVALLQMRRGELALLIAERILANGAFRPGARDYRALIGPGYAVKNSANGYHDLTSRGRTAADSLARDLARQFGVHYTDTVNSTRYQFAARCTCGWSQAFQKSEGGHRAGIGLAIGNHLASVEAIDKIEAALKPPTMEG